eukprot:485710_1
MSSKQRLKSVDIGIFYGIRILLNIGVLLLHAVIFSMNFTIHSSMNAMNDQDTSSLPWSSISSVISSLLSSSFTWIFNGVDAFHFMSAFLCTYQLCIMTKTYSTSFTTYALFFINRLLRIYPIYILVICYTYFYTPSLDLYGNCSSPWHITKSLLFIDNFWDNAIGSGCSGIGWFLSRDIHIFIIIISLFYMFYPKNIHILKYALYGIFILSWMASIYAFHIYCMPYMRFEKGNIVSVLKQGIDLYEPNQLRSLFEIDPYKYIDKSVFDPDNLSNDEWRNIMLNSNYLTSQYIWTYTHIGSGLLGCLSCLQIMKNEEFGVVSYSYGTLLKFMLFNWICSVLSSLVSIQSMTYLPWFYFSNSIFSSVLLGSHWNLITLTVFCGLNLWLRVNNRFLNRFFNNGITRFLSKYMFGVYMMSDLVTSYFVSNDDFRRSISVPGESEEKGQILMAVCGKSIVLSFSIAIVMYYLVEYPFMRFRKQYIFNSAAKISKQKIKSK